MKKFTLGAITMYLFMQLCIIILCEKDENFKNGLASAWDKQFPNHPFP